MRGKKHSDETRSEALAALLAGQNIQEIAAKYKLPESTVRDLKKSLTAEQFAEVREKKQLELAELIEGHLKESLKAAANIARQTENASWLTKQDADKLGVFYGIITDKAVRILEAADAADSPSESETWPAVVR